KWARKLGWLGVLVAYVPIPLPIMPVVFVLTGASGMKVRWFIALDFVAATIWNLGYLGLGWGVGDPIVDALKYYAKIANWVAIALIIVILAPIFVKKKQKA
ncbi:DedA family protein, partial [Xanthomonas citri pv. citri]|nr:DedA family protein [Xanthomonas citri pv. citri]